MRNKINKEKLISRLVKIRTEKGLTQSIVAKNLGRPQSFVSKYESGERNLDFIEVFEVLESLGSDPIEVITEMYR